jgi:anti-sigma-K factor RskA
MVRAHLATCAECQAEIAELWLAVDSLPSTIEPMEPPPALRDRIAAAIMAEAASPAPAPPAPPVAPAPEPVSTIAPAPPAAEPVRRPASFWSRATPWAAAAAILLLLSAGLLVWNLRLREQIATAPVTETIALAATDAAPEARGEVTYLPQDDLFILDVRDLPPLEPDQVYEVWLIGEDGVPAPAGVFDQPTDQHAIVADRDRYDTLAITAEPGPLGTEAPTGEIVATAPL